MRNTKLTRATRSLRLTTSVVFTMLVCSTFITHARAQSYTFTVPGNTGEHYLDTRIDVSVDTLISLQAKGKVNVNKDRQGNYIGEVGPEGIPEAKVPLSERENPPYFPADTATRYGLVADVLATDGVHGGAWDYGSSTSFCVPFAGRLRLTVNDNLPDDNRGSFSVGVTLRGNCGRSAPAIRRATAEMRLVAAVQSAILFKREDSLAV